MSKKNSANISKRLLREKINNTLNLLEAIKRLKIPRPSLKSYQFTITALKPFKNIKQNQQIITFPKNKHPNKNQPKKLLLKVMKKMKLFQFHAYWSQAIRIVSLVLILRMNNLNKIKYLILLKQKVLGKKWKWKKTKNVQSVHNQELNPNNIANKTK